MNADFRGKGASPTNRSWYQISRVIALSCGIKISAVRHLVLSQSTRVTDRRTDGRTDRITTPKTALAYARAVKISDHVLGWSDETRDLGVIIDKRLNFNSHISAMVHKAHVQAFLILRSFVTPPH